MEGYANLQTLYYCVVMEFNYTIDFALFSTDSFAKAAKLLNIEAYVLSEDINCIQMCNCI